MPNAYGWQQDHGRCFSAPAERNQRPILATLQRTLPFRGLVLEIASGGGQHIARFAEALPHLVWQPSEPDAALRDSIRAWIAACSLGNVSPPIDLDVRRLPWPVRHADAVLCINMLHVAPWAAAEALFAGAVNVLDPAGLLFLYGPFRRFGAHTSPGNEAFDAELRAKDPAWGLRDLEAVVEAARASGFAVGEIVEMPANNLGVEFRKRS